MTQQPSRFGKRYYDKAIAESQGKRVACPLTKRFGGHTYQLVSGVYTKPAGSRYTHELRRKGRASRLHKVGTGAYRVYVRR